MTIEKKELFISVDVETSGPIPGDFSLLSFGACLIGNEEKTFQCEVKPVNMNADPKALEITGLSLDTLLKTGLTPLEAMESFDVWLKGLSNENVSLVFVGFNAPFDWSFINYYFIKYLGKNPFGFSALDIKALYMGTTGCTWSDTRSSQISNHLHPKGEGDHNPLHDALYQAEIFKLVRKIRPACPR